MNDLDECNELHQKQGEKEVRTKSQEVELDVNVNIFVNRRWQRNELHIVEKL